jgi:2-polyprenyl-3-methyl-5-hydroxy-6-metoxy-1,4-benzoquinol methylase
MSYTAATSVYSRAVEKSGLSLTHLTALSLVPSDATVLEIGPASGYMTQALGARGCTVDAIEIDPSDGERARPFCRHLVVGSAEDQTTYEQLAGPYRIALMADVLEHLRSPELALREVRRRLATDGEAIVSLPNIAYWRMRVDLLRGRFQYKDYGLLDRTHLRFYTRATAEKLFRDQGFEVMEVHIPPPRAKRLKRLKHFAKTAWPDLFALQIVYRLRPLPDSTTRA